MPFSDDRRRVSVFSKQVLTQVTALIGLGHDLWGYIYMRAIAARSPELCYATVLAAPSRLLPVMYTPTVGEACQKFGSLPFYNRGCYISIAPPSLAPRRLPGPRSDEEVAADRTRCLLFMSTTVNHGHGRAVVVATGMRTEFGKTFQEMKSVEQRKTPLQVREEEGGGGDRQGRGGRGRTGGKGGGGRGGGGRGGGC